MAQVALMPMRKTLDALSETAKKLNAKTDELNEVIAEFEQALQDAGVGVSLWLNPPLLIPEAAPYRFDPRDRDEQYPIEVTRGWQLGYAKVDGEWRVAVRYVRYESPSEPSDDSKVFEERDPEPLAKAPRIVRVEAAPILESLAMALTKKMAGYIKGIESAKEMAKS